MARTTKKGAAQFFYDNAGYSYPARASAAVKERERRNNAQALAEAEFWAWDNDYAFRWEHDPEITSREWADEGPEYRAWMVNMLDPEGEVVQALGGVDLGENGEPWGDSYARVVEAELALEEMPE